MTRSEAIKKLIPLFNPLGTVTAIAQAQAERAIDLLDEALHFDSEVVEVSAQCHAVGRMK